MCDVGYKCLLSGKGGVNMWTEGKQGRMGKGMDRGKGNREGRGMWTGGERCRWVDRWRGWGNI